MSARNLIVMLTAIATVLLFSFSTATAQIPTDGLQLRLDANTVSGSAGDAVTSWADQSGNGRDAAAGNESPALGDWPLLSGLKTVNFTGAAQSLITSGYAIPTDKPYHVFVVDEYRNIGDPGADGSWISTANPSSGGDGDLLRPVSNSDGGVRVFTGGGFPTGMYDAPTGMHPEGPGIVEAVNAAVAGTPGEFRAYTSYLDAGGSMVRNQLPFDMNNSGDNSISTANRDAAPEHDLTIGKPRIDAGRSLNGTIAEMIIYDRVLSSAESAQVQDYLTGKWFVPEPSTFVLFSLGMVALVGLRRRIGRS